MVNCPKSEIPEGPTPWRGPGSEFLQTERECLELKAELIVITWEIKLEAQGRRVIKTSGLLEPTKSSSLVSFPSCSFVFSFDLVMIAR